MKKLLMVLLLSGCAATGDAIKYSVSVATIVSIVPTVESSINDSLVVIDTNQNYSPEERDELTKQIAAARFVLERITYLLDRKDTPYLLGNDIDFLLKQGKESYSRIYAIVSPKISGFSPEQRHLLFKTNNELNALHQSWASLVNRDGVDVTYLLKDLVNVLGTAVKLAAAL